MTISNAQLDRRDVVTLLLKDRNEKYGGKLLVITGLGSPTYDVHAVGDHDGNFYLWGAMGSAALTGLGLAMAKPDYRVLVITGDGEQLMGLGGLATIGVKNPPNLSIVVIDNAHYGETGMQKSHTASGVDLVGIARSCGFSRCSSIDDIVAVKTLASQLFVDKGASFVSIRVIAKNYPRSIPVLDGGYLKNRLRGYLGLQPN